MINFIEVDGVEKGSKYAINVDHISKFYPVTECDKNFAEDYFNSEGLASLILFADDNLKEKMDKTKNDILNANCIIEIISLDKESNVVCTPNTYEEVKIKIFNAATNW